MKNTILIFATIALAVFSSCNQNQLRVHKAEIVENTIYNLTEDPIFKFDTTKMSMDERLKKLVETSCLRQFNRGRTDFIEKDINNVFKVGEIQKKGSNYQYEVTCDDYEIAFKYICTPDVGEYNMYVFGVDSIVNIYYKNVKLMQKWDECHKSDNGESCSATKQIEVYPVKTFFKFDYIKINEKISQLTYFRKHLPQYSNK